MKKHQDKSRTGLNRVEDQTTPTQENTRGESHASSWFDGHGVYLWKTPGVATAGEEHRPGTDSMSQHLTVPLIWWWEEQKSLESLFAACAPNPILSLGDGNKADSKYATAIKATLDAMWSALPALPPLLDQFQLLALMTSTKNKRRKNPKSKCRR